MNPWKVVVRVSSISRIIQLDLIYRDGAVAIVGSDGQLRWFANQLAN